jgi:tetratricopeptide (TPR) repeat protein
VPDLIGRRLGHYVIESALGQGGMGEVYRAVDSRLRRPVAVKVLSREVVSPARRERFLREAQSASALNHPGIVTIHDIGRDGGLDFIVMEQVQGRTLREVLRDGPLAVDQALEYARQAASALGAAHAAGIVHRDLKPQNLMVTPGGQLKVLDFGLAHVAAAEVDSVSPTEERLTLLGTVLGTPGYMSPEQAEGRPVDARSDVFSLGVVLYEMLTGTVPFRGTSVAGILYGIVHHQPEPAGRLRPGLPEDLARVLATMLQKDPARRYADGTELLRALSGTPGRKRWAPSPARAADWLRRRLVPVGAALVLAVLAGLASLAPVRSRLTGLSARLTAEPTSPFALYRQGSEALARYHEPKAIEGATEAFQRAIALDPGYAPGYVGLAEAAWRAYRRDRDPAQIERALGYARHAVATDGQLAAAHAVLGLVAVEAGRLEEARLALDQALALDPTSARAHRAHGQLLAAQARTAEAEAAFARAVESAPADWELRLAVGAFFFQAGRYADAAAAFREASRLSPDNPLPWRNLGAAQHMLGQLREASASLQRSLEIAPDPIVYGNLGTVYFFQGLYPQAIAALERAVEMGPNDAVNWRNLADAYRLSPGRDGDARDAYARAVQIVRGQLEKQPGDAALRADLALCLARQGRAEEARRETAAVEAAAPTDPLTFYTLALASEAMGARDRALASLARALELGYSMSEVSRDVELGELRKDVRYHRLVVRFEGDGSKAP